jgi:hypothetical protein
MQSQRLIHSQESISISDLACELQLSVATILNCATEGIIPFFFPTFPNDYACLSVDDRRINIDQTFSQSTENVKRAKTTHQINIETAAKVAVRSIMMGVDKIEGVVLAGEDCRQLIEHQRLSQHLFPAAVWKSLAGYDFLQPIHGLSILGRRSDNEKWKIACYDRAQSTDLNIGQRVPMLIRFNIKPWQLFTRGEDVHRFKEIIYSPCYITALLEQDKYFDCVNVIAERPAYFSEKLIYLIETSERIWRTATPIQPSEYEGCRNKVFAQLGSDYFKSLFSKNYLAPGTRAVAANFIEPIFARKVVPEDLKEGLKGYLSPELFKLMAAAKLFWSSPHVVLDEVLTHPKNQSIESYFRTVGISGNNATAAATLIRPERAARGGNGTSIRTDGFKRFFTHTFD